MRIYLPKKIIFKGRSILMSTEIESITVSLYKFSTLNENFLLSLLKLDLNC